MKSHQNSELNIYGPRVKLLQYEDIIRTVEDHTLLIEPFNPDLVSISGGYELRIGEFVTISKKSLDTTREQVSDLTKPDTLVLRPGEVGIIRTIERLELQDNLAADLILRSRYAMLLGMSPWMGRIKGNWEGQILFEIQNNSTQRAVALTTGNAILQLEIYEIYVLPKAPDRPY